MVEYRFLDGMAYMMEQVYETSKAHGFEFDNKAEKIALMHSELSEALEAIRAGGAQSKKIKFPQEVEELADCVIRIMDYCHYFDLPLAEAIVAKNEYNKQRPHKHGKEF